MPKRFKERIDFSSGLLDVARARVNDVPRPIENSGVIDNLAYEYLINKGALPPITAAETKGRVQASNESIYLKDLKYAISSLNTKINTTDEFARLNAKDVFSTLFEMQRQVYKIEAEVGEAEIKMINGYSKVHLNTFTRQLDAGIQYEDARWLTDFKSFVSYPEKQMLSLLPSAGLTLPVKSRLKIPIVNAYLVDEKTDVGETVVPVISTSPRNVFLENKVFRHVVVRRESDSTIRKYKSKTSYDTYPYSAVSTVTLELELASTCSINYLKINPVNSTVFSIRDISYLNEAGEQISIVSQSIDTDLEKSLIFEPIQTKFIRITFEQVSRLTVTTADLYDSEKEEINKMLSGAGLSVEVDSKSESISGRWYDFSIRDIEVGQILYENKGIFRSKAVKVKSPIGLEISRFIETFTPQEIFSEYYKTVTLPEGEAKSEAYAGIKLFNKDGGTKVDSLVPVPDSYPVQIEFIDFRHTDARVKLFPDLEWNYQRNCIESVYPGEICISLDDIVPDYEAEGSNPTDNAEQDSESDGKYTPDSGTYKELILGSKMRSYCLLPGEEIVISDSGDTLAIEKIEIGDSVYTYNYIASEFGEYAVTGITMGYSGSWLEIYFKNISEPLRCSPGHHMLDEEFNQIPASGLSEGDFAWYLTSNGTLGLTEIEEIVLNEEHVRVYNIEVEEAHTYITANGILQHNGRDDIYTTSNKIETQSSTGLNQSDSKIIVAPTVGDPADTESWKTNYHQPKSIQTTVKKKRGKGSIDTTTLSHFIGSSWNALGNDDQEAILSDSELSTTALGVGRVLVGGSSESSVSSSVSDIPGSDSVTDNTNPSYVRVTPLHTQDRDLNLVGSAYWDTMIAEVDVTLDSDSSSDTEDVYNVSIRKPKTPIKDSNLDHISPKDRLNLNRLDTIHDLASKTRFLFPDRKSGLTDILKTAKEKESLDTINKLVNSMLSAKVGYIVNKRGAYELAVADSRGSSSDIFAKAWAATTVNKTYQLSNFYQTWGTFDFTQMQGALDFVQGKYGDEPVFDSSTIKEELKKVKDCIQYLTFNTENPHGLVAGDLVSLTSIDERFSGVYVVGLVNSLTSFSIPVDAFRGLVFNLGITVHNPNNEVWSAKTSVLPVADTTEELLGVEEIVNETSSDPRESLAEAIYLSLDWADSNVTFQTKALSRSGYDIYLSVYPLSTDPSLKPSAFTGSLITNGNVSATEWTFSSDSWDTVITVNSTDDIIDTDDALTKEELKALNDTKICIWNQNREDPLEVYEDERLLKLGVDYSISLDDKSTWYDYFPIPGDSTYSYLNKRAKAGRFYVRVQNRNPNAIYWIKYRVKRDQALSACELVRLKNGRVVFDKSLRNTFGTIQTIFIFRTNSTNPYITPILREYALKIKESKNYTVGRSNLADIKVMSRKIQARRNVT